MLTPLYPVIISHKLWKLALLKASGKGSLLILHTFGTWIQVMIAHLPWFTRLLAHLSTSLILSGHVSGSSEVSCKHSNRVCPSLLKTLSLSLSFL